jgi:hypothetical protein
MNFKILFFLFTIVGISCGKIQLDGMTFYTVQGKISDSFNQGKANVGLDIYVEKTFGTFLNANSTDRAITASSKTDQNGNFKITFPKSNGEVYLLLQNGYGVIDSIAINSGNSHLIKLDMEKLNNNLLEINTIKIKGL